MFIIEEEKRFLESEEVSKNIEMNAFHWMTILGIAKEQKVSGKYVIEVIINNFLDNYWKNGIDKKLDAIHAKNYAKEFMLDYAKYLIENDEELHAWAYKVVNRLNYKKTKPKCQERYHSDIDKSREYNRTWYSKNKERLRIKRYDKYHSDDEYREEMNEKKREWRKNNKEKENSQQRTLRKKKKEVKEKKRIKNKEPKPISRGHKKKEDVSKVDFEKPMQIFPPTKANSAN